jgi:hypothetical protein
MAGPIGRAEHVLTVLWPAFVMAGVLEAMVFAVVDPESLTWFGGAPLGLTRQAVYTVTFFIFWGVIASAATMTTLLLRPAGPRPAG